MRKITKKDKFPVKPLLCDAPANKNDKLFRVIINNISDELILIDRGGSIVYANTAAARGLRYSAKTLCKKRITDFYAEKITLEEWTGNYFEELKKIEKPISYKLERIVRNGQKRTIEVSAVYMKYGAGEYILSIARDITERRSSQHRRADYDKMSALGLLVSGTAQEIKYPLEAIRNQLNVMVQKYKKRDFEYIGFKEFQYMMQMMTNINSQVEHCCDITNRLLMLNKKKAGIGVGACDANNIIRELINRLSKELDFSNVRVVLNLAKRLPAVAIKQDDLNQVVRNIASNAIQAMPSGGKLSIKSAHKKAEGQILLVFRDTGVGIPKENLSRVFEAFFTTRPGGLGQGVGLGLSVIYSIIKRAKGDIAIQSSLRQGTAIKINLPAYTKLSRK